MNEVGLSITNDPSTSGNLVLPEHPILSDAEADKVALLAIVVGLLRNIMSSDVIFLAMMSAQDQAVKHKCTPAQFERVQKLILDKWQEETGRNPMRGMFE